MKNKNSNNNIMMNLIWKFGERIAAQLVTFIVSIVLARKLLPEHYGAISIVMIFISIANVFVTGGFGNSLIQKKNADNKDFSTVFYFNIIFSVFVYMGLFYIAPGIANFYDMEILTAVIRILGIRIIIASINSVQQAYVSRNMLFKRFFWSTLLGTIFSGIVGIIMAYKGFGIWALVAQYLTNTITDTLVLWFTVKWRPQLIFSFRRLRSLFEYGWKLLFSSLLDTGYLQLRGLIIGKIYSSSDLAFYEKGQQYPNLVVTNINTSIGSVFFPAIAKEQDNKEKVKKMTRIAIQVSSYIMWPMMIGLAIIAKPLVLLMLTDKWLPCVPYLQIACITYAFWPIHTANLQAIKALGRSDIFLKIEIIKKVIGIGVLLLVMKSGVMAIAISAIFVTVIGSFINAYPNLDLLQYRYKDQVKDIMPYISLSILMAIVIYPIGNIINNNFLKILIQIVSGSTFYLLASSLLKLRGYQYIKEVVSKRFKFKLFSKISM